MSHENVETTTTQAEDEVEENVVFETEENVMEEDTVGCSSDQPERGMMFETYNHLMEYYTAYGNKLGFAVKTRTSRKGGKGGKDGHVKYVTIVCSRAGNSKSRSKNPLKPHATIKVGCRARLSAVREEDGGKWQITSVTLDHNHDMSPSKSRFLRSRRVLKPHVKRRLEVNDRVGIPLNKSFNSLVVEAGGHENLPFLEKDCRNYIQKVNRLQLGEGDAAAMQAYFLKMQAENDKFFYTVDFDAEGHLRNVLWADARSRAAYQEFGDVITFDTTYLTNKYDMPFAPFVGVNHHGQSTLFGCGLISNEDTETFTWLFRAWLAGMSGKAPHAIITYQDPAIQTAIETVFPDAKHRWCLWHVMKKLLDKLRGCKQYQSIKSELQMAVYDSKSCADFEERWSGMIEEFTLHDNHWLSGLYNERRRWVPIFLKNIFWAGMTTTQRSEGMNAFFDGYVNSKTTLKQFVEKYEEALKSRVEKENFEDHRSFGSQIPCATHYDMEAQVQEVYTLAKFREFQNELTGKIYCHINTEEEDEGGISEYEVQEAVRVEGEMKTVTHTVRFNASDCEVKCSCCLFEFRGILCRHALTVLLRRNIQSLPDRYIMPRWRKDVKRCHTKVKISYNCPRAATPQEQRFDEMTGAFNYLATIASEDEYKKTHVMEVIQKLTEEIQQDHGVGGSCLPSPTTLTASGSGGDRNTNILNPLAKKGMGRPRVKRRQSIAEQGMLRNSKRKAPESGATM